MKLVFLASTLAAFSASTAFAQAPPPAGPPQSAPSLPPPPTKYPQRRVGIGTAFGAGVGAYQIIGVGQPSDHDAVAPAVMLPTLELQFFLPNDFSIDVTTPLVNEILTSVVFRGFAFSADVFLNFNFGEGNVQAVLGPGIGFSVIAADDAVGSLRVPAEAGVELLTNNQAFGFKIMARPWVEFAAAPGQDVYVGGGALALLGLSGFLTD